MRKVLRNPVTNGCCVSGDKDDDDDLTFIHVPQKVVGFVTGNRLAINGPSVKKAKQNETKLNETKFSRGGGSPPGLPTPAS